MPNLIAFAGGNSGNWRICAIHTVCGAAVAPVTHLNVTLINVTQGSQTQYIEMTPPPDLGWTLHGRISNLRYATRTEVTRLRGKQEGLGRPQARCAALIPIKKSPAWWDLAQDERRSIFEAQSHHTAVGLDYLPAISRQLYHARDLGEPFDFLTWFEFAPEHRSAFETLLTRLRNTPEWTYIEREVDIRLERDD